MFDPTADQVKRLHDVLGQHVDVELAEWMMSQALWAQRLTAPDAAGPVTVGGDPLLPPEATWPRWRGRWLSLLAVIDLAALDAGIVELDLPPVRKVNLFYDLANPLGEGHQWVPGHYVVPVADDAVPTEPPDRSVRRLDPVTYAVRPVLTIPRYDESLVRRRWDLDEADDPWIDPRLNGITNATHEWEALCDADGTCDEGQIGGWPSLYQNPIFDACAASTHAAEAGVRVVAPGGSTQRWRQLAQFGWNTVLDPLLGDTRIHYCYNAADGRQLVETSVHWQGT